MVIQQMTWLCPTQGYIIPGRVKSVVIMSKPSQPHDPDGYP